VKELTLFQPPTRPWKTLKTRVAARANLVGYCKRIRERWWKDLEAP
jgi:hypothetical protein